MEGTVLSCWTPLSRHSGQRRIRVLLRLRVCLIYPHRVRTTYCIFLSIALLFYDYFLTLPDEVRCVWKGKFTGVTVLFMINRYATIVYRTLMVIQLMSWDTYPEETADTVSCNCTFGRPALTPVVQM